MAHTPGPWKATEDDPRGCCVIANGGTICDVGNVAKGKWRANARLIAAAPELLAALEEAMEFLANGTPIHPGALVQASIFNAIVKAKGGAA